MSGSVRADGDAQTENHAGYGELPSQAAEARHVHARQARERLKVGQGWQDHGLALAGLVGTPLIASDASQVRVRPVAPGLAPSGHLQDR
jgi:hypothetical protein